MADQIIAVDSMSDAVRSPEENAKIAEDTASVSADAEQTTDVESTSPSEEMQNTVEDTAAESKDSNQSIPYSRFAEVITERNQLREKAELLDKLQSDPQFANSYFGQGQQTDPNDQEAQAKEALKKLGVPDVNEIESLIEQKVQQERIYREIDAKVEKLQKEWDGKGGKPRFDVEEVLEYGNKTGVFDPEAAFKLIHEKELADFYAKQAKTGVKTERQGKPVQNVGQDNEALIKEARRTGDWTKVLQNRL